MLDNFRYAPLTAAGALPDEAVMQGALRQALQDHPRVGDYDDVYVTGRGPMANAAKYLF